MQKTGGPFLAIYMSYDVFLRKEFPYGRRNDCTCVKSFSGVILIAIIPQRVNVVVLTLSYVLFFHFSHAETKLKLSCRYTGS